MSLLNVNHFCDSCCESGVILLISHVRFSVITILVLYFPYILSIIFILHNYA